MNINKLKAAMVEAGYSQRTLAKVMNMSKNTLNAKINGKSAFTIDEATALSEKLQLTKEDFENIFLRASSQIGTK